MSVNTDASERLDIPLPEGVELNEVIGIVKKAYRHANQPGNERTPHWRVLNTVRPHLERLGYEEGEVVGVFNGVSNYLVEIGEADRDRLNRIRLA